MSYIKREIERMEDDLMTKQMKSLYVKYVMVEKYSYDLDRLLDEIKGRIMRDFADKVGFNRVYSFELRYDQVYIIDDGISRLQASEGEYYRMIKITKANGSDHRFRFEREIIVTITYEER